MLSFKNPLTLAIAAAAASSVAKAALVEHFWNISYATANPDGQFERRVIGVNGTWPPPPIIVNQNDTLRVHAYNGLGDVGTALHSHGIFFNQSTWFDGAVGLSQCPIPPGETLVYEIPVDRQAGSYWIHGHYKGQYVDGLRAPLIIQPAVPRTDITWDDEYTLILSDWYHKQHDDMLNNEFLTWTNPTGAEPVPESAMLYFMHNGSYVHTQAEIASGVGNNNDAVLALEPNKKYKIRVISMAAFSMFHVQFDQHDMSVIEVDGVEIEPYVVTDLQLSVAQRYAILLETKNSTDTNYAIMVQQDPDMYDTIPDDITMNNTLQLQYNADAPAATEVLIDEWPALDETKFTPVDVVGMADVDQPIYLEFNFDTFDDGTNRAYFNETTYQQPEVPTVVTAMTMGNDSFNPAVYGAMTNPLIVNHMDVVELTVVNLDSGTHPFHLHGHVFQVTRKSFNTSSDDPLENPSVDETNPNPIRRDTIAIPAGGAVSLRFRGDNPGVWFFHCHIDWHLSSGLAAEFIIAPDVMQSTLSLPDSITNQCSAQGIATSGNIVGTFSTTDFKGQPWGPFLQVIGWTPKAIGALAGCVITAVLGFITIVWYGWGELNEEEVEDEIKRQIAAKQASGGKLGFLKGKFGGAH